jgi:hypothetical protein
MDSYFKSTNSTSITDVKRYFYVAWDNKFIPTKEAYWTNTRPENINFIEQVKCEYIKTGFYFYICGYFPDNDENSYHLPKEKTYKNIAYLKSHLQKCIRKQNDNLAIPTSLHLIKLDLNDFLRRIIIIMLEDVFLHQSFTTLVWLMIANSTKKLKMKKYIYEWLLGVIYLLCTINEKDFVDDIYYNQQISKKNIDILNEYTILGEDECSLLYSIHLRIAYGGMECDMKMLKAFSYCWFDRFKNNTIRFNITPIKPIKITVSELKITDWDLSAIDYHCCQKIIELILKKYDDLTENELKKMIWINSSSINTRCSNREYNIEKWNEIKNYISKTQKYLLESSY